MLLHAISYAARYFPRAPSYNTCEQWTEAQYVHLEGIHKRKSRTQYFKGFGFIDRRYTCLYRQAGGQTIWIWVAQGPF